jgi:hypothetical protein
MYSRTVPADISIVRTDIGNFCAASGFAKVAEDTVALKKAQWGQTDYFLPGSGRYLVLTAEDGDPVSLDADVAGHRLVLKDPAGNCYVHLIFYTTGHVWYRQDRIEQVAYMDGYLSTGYTPGAVDSHPGICKMTAWRSLPPSFTGMDMYSGTNSDGSLWVHVALEERPLVFNHMGFGSIEKSLDFTGGDFISPNSACFIKDDSSRHAAYCGYCDGGANLGVGMGLYLAAGFYCPDLDSDGKSDAGNGYRSLVGDSSLTRPDMERGCTSWRCASGLSDGTYAMDGSGGDVPLYRLPLPNPWSGTSPLFPIYVYASNGLDVKYKGQAGYFKGVRAVNVKNYNPKDEITLGGDVWVTYPLCAKEGVLAYPWHSFDQGYAVLKNG